MLRPTERITNRRTLVRTRSSDQRLRNFVKKHRRNAANFLYHLWRVTSEVAAQRLENATRMLQGQIAFGEAKAAIAMVEPALPVVAALLPVPAGKKAGGSFIGIAKIFAQNAGCVGEVDDVIAKEEIILDNVADESAEKGDIAAGAHRHPAIGQRARGRNTRIDVNDGRAALLCFHDPAETDWMRFGHRRAFD